jgi:hypothetical protein
LPAAAWASSIVPPIRSSAAKSLLAGYEGMKQREKMIPAQGRIRLPEAVERLVQLYEATGKKDEAAKRQAELQKLKPSAKP